MIMVLRKSDQKFIQDNSKEIMEKMKEYRAITGKGWHPFNYELGYANMKEWYDALVKEVRALQE